MTQGVVLSHQEIGSVAHDRHIMHRARIACTRDWAWQGAPVQFRLAHLVMPAERRIAKQELLYVGREFLRHVARCVAQRAGKRQHERVMRTVHAAWLPTVHGESSCECCDGAGPRDTVASIVAANEES